VLSSWKKPFEKKKKKKKKRKEKGFFFFFFWGKQIRKSHCEDQKTQPMGADPRAEKNFHLTIPFPGRALKEAVN
jgi:hypothetical protein